MAAPPQVDESYLFSPVYHDYHQANMVFITLKISAPMYLSTSSSETEPYPTNSQSISPETSPATTIAVAPDFEDSVESLSGYCLGSYHPTHLGDRFLDSRYEVVHKLGWGSYATVWLAKDHLEAKYVAMKILAANSSERCSENKILHALNSGQSDHPGRAYIPSILNDFTISGPNGRHLCIVSEVAGCTLAQTRRDPVTLNFPVNMARSVVAQLLLGLDYIHSCGVVHGDLHLNNILLRQHFENMTTDPLYACLGEPVRVSVKRLGEDSPGFPKYCVPPAYIITQSSEQSVDAQIIISDFGEAFFQNEQHKKLHTPTLLLPPGSIFCEPVGQAADMWTLACTLYHVIGQSVLFEGLFPDKDDMVADMISTLGPLPRRWWDRWGKRGEFFLDNGSVRQDSPRLYLAPFRPLSERLCSMGRYEFSPEEMACFANLLRAMLSYEPSDRITASAAIGSERMEGWARRSISQT